MNDTKYGGLIRSRPITCLDSAIFTLCRRHWRSKYRWASSCEDGVGFDCVLRFEPFTDMRLNGWAILNPLYSRLSSMRGRQRACHLLATGRATWIVSMPLLDVRGSQKVQ